MVPYVVGFKSYNSNLAILNHKTLEDNLTDLRGRRERKREEEMYNNEVEQLGLESQAQKIINPQSNHLVSPKAND